MSLSWIIVLAAAALAFGLKLVGYLVPRTWLASPAVQVGLGAATIALLAALVATQTLTTDGRLVLDARLAALGVAGALLWLWTSFVCVVFVAVAVASTLLLLF